MLPALSSLWCRVTVENSICICICICNSFLYFIIKINVASPLIIVVQRASCKQRWLSSTATSSSQPSINQFSFHLIVFVVYHIVVVVVVVNQHLEVVIYLMLTFPSYCRQLYKNSNPLAFIEITFVQIHPYFQWSIMILAIACFCCAPNSVP